MKVFELTKDVINYILEQKSINKTIGFVPTMGALHKGHGSLIERAVKENDICVCSIFVNPVQFNNIEDYTNYPLRKNEDIILLKHNGCHIVFCPTKAEMYPKPPSENYSFGTLEKFMEGASRKGHFNGVAIVVKRLFDIVMPDKAYFGEKDFQQLRIIEELVKQQNFPIEIVRCPTMREADGLAMSSRNLRLDKYQRKMSSGIAKILQSVIKLSHEQSIGQVKKYVSREISKMKGFKLDYFEIAEEETLIPAKQWVNNSDLRAFIAVYAGEIRLIDNMKIIL